MIDFYRPHLGYDIYIRAAVAAKTAGVKVNEFTRQVLEEKLVR